MGLLQLVHGEVHSASPAVCHHVAVSCGGEHGHTLPWPLQPRLTSTLAPCPEPCLLRDVGGRRCWNRRVLD